LPRLPAFPGAKQSCPAILPAAALHRLAAYPTSALPHSQHAPRRCETRILTSASLHPPDVN
jgi:hypothetical protein